MANSMINIPVAACVVCGGWTSYGGMSQHATSEKKVKGRTGCTCPKIVCYVCGTVLRPDGNWRKIGPARTETTEAHISDDGYLYCEERCSVGTQRWLDSEVGKNSTMFPYFEATAEKREVVNKVRRVKREKTIVKKPCTCGCGETTGGGNFRPGHDAKLKGRIVTNDREGLVWDTGLSAVAKAYAKEHWFNWLKKKGVDI